MHLQGDQTESQEGRLINLKGSDHNRSMPEISF